MDNTYVYKIQSYCFKEKVKKLPVFPMINLAINEFLALNQYMVASSVGHNILIEKVLRLLYHLVKFGFYDSPTDIEKLQKPLLSLLNGKYDIPFPKKKAREKGR